MIDVIKDDVNEDQPAEENIDVIIEEASTENQEVNNEYVRPRHRLEVKNRGHLYNIIDGPYKAHNVLITHAEFLKTTNKDKALKLYRIFPTGGSFNLCGDIFASVVWYSVVLYSIAVIPIAVYGEIRFLNITNAIVLCLILMYNITAAYGVTKNRKKLRRALYVAETQAPPVTSNKSANVVNTNSTVKNEKVLCLQISSEKYAGLQNVFIDVTVNNVLETNLLNSTQRQKILRHLVHTQAKSMVVMLCTKSYWRNTVIAPVVCLSVTAIISLVGVFVQFITMVS